MVAPLQRWLLGKFLEGREFVHTVDAGPATGLRYPITLPQDKGIWTGTYEVELARRIAAAVRPGTVCLDIGGWRGFFSGVMALAGASKILVFEPLPANATQIRRTLELNPKLSIELIEAAVGETEGRLEFVVMPESSMGKLAASSFQAEQRGGQKISVRVVAVDELIATGKFAPPAMLKIDVEGAEMFVLRGARQLLAARKPELFIEVHSPALAKECDAFLTGLGYEILILEKLAPETAHGNPEICHFIARARSPHSTLP